MRNQFIRTLDLVWSARKSGGMLNRRGRNRVSCILYNRLRTLIRVKQSQAHAVSRYLRSHSRKSSCIPVAQSTQYLTTDMADEGTAVDPRRRPAPSDFDPHHRRVASHSKLPTCNRTKRDGHEVIRSGISRLRSLPRRL